MILQLKFKLLNKLQKNQIFFKNQITFNLIFIKKLKV